MFKLLNRFNLHVFYRHTSHNTNHGKARPEWFSHEICLRNFLRTMAQHSDKRIKVYLHFLFDGSQLAFDADFSSALLAGHEDNEHQKIKSITVFDGGSGRASVLKAKELIDSKKVNKGDYVYLLENDYLHTADWLSCVADLLSSSVRFDYFSLYDHGDKYQGTSGFLKRYTELRSRIFVTQSRHWRTAPSTCFSFITTKDILQEDWPLINIGQHDHVVFRILREVNRRILLTPMPGLSTHCMTAGMSPIVQWEELAREVRTSDWNVHRRFN